MSGRQIDHRLLRSSSLWRRKWDWSINRLLPIIRGALDLQPFVLVSHLKPFFHLFDFFVCFFLPLNNLWILLSTSLHDGFNSSSKKFASEIKDELQFLSCSGCKSLVTHPSATQAWRVIILWVAPVFCCAIKQLKWEEAHWHAAGLPLQIYSV